MKGIILLADYFEDIEALGTVDLIRRAKIDIDLVSMKDNVNLITQSNISIKADKTIINTNLQEYDFLIIPGGKAVMLTHQSSELTKDIIDYFMHKKALIACICAAPSLLGKNGYLDNVNYTCFPSFEKFSEKGIYDSSKKVVVSNNIITACSAGATFEFSYEIIKYLKGKNVADHIIDGVIYYR